MKWDKKKQNLRMLIVAICTLSLIVKDQILTNLCTQNSKCTIINLIEKTEAVVIVCMSIKKQFNFCFSGVMLRWSMKNVIP